MSDNKLNIYNYGAIATSANLYSSMLIFMPIYAALNGNTHPTTSVARCLLITTEQLHFKPATFCSSAGYYCNYCCAILKDYTIVSLILWPVHFFGVYVAVDV